MLIEITLGLTAIKRHKYSLKQSGPYMGKVIRGLEDTAAVMNNLKVNKEFDAI